MLTFDKTRKTKTAKLMTGFCEHYQSLLENDVILPDTSFPFVYFFSCMNYRKHFDYAILPKRHRH